MRTIRIFIFFCWLGATTAFGQEVCNNDVDDDGDGFIDCYDSECANNSFCDGTFLGNDVSCQAQPTQFPTFSMKKDWFSDNKTAVHFGRMAIGDLDNDGIPEVVTFNTYDEWVYILNGSDGTVKRSRDVDNEYRRRFRHDIAIANLDGDNCGEIFVMAKENSDDDYRITSYDCNLNRLWRRDIDGDDLGSLGLADFNGDGSIELYYKNEILNAHTGEVLVAGVGDFDDLAQGTVAVDIQGDNDLELIEGGNIYDVDLVAGTATITDSLPGYYVKGSNFSSSSVADYNQDGNLDILATGADSTGVTTVFFWDVTNGTVLSYSDAFGTGDYEFGWEKGTGRVNIADIDGDGNLNATYVSGEYLYALDENMNRLWRSQINEQSSGFTGCTLFDFNGDGISEIVYRDEQWLYIINGKDGTQYDGAAVACISRTGIEYPIVADVDGDGATELCVTCGFNNANAWANFWDIDYAENSHVRVFESAGEPWVPARRLWNQHAYFNVNVNDDLTIPEIQQKHHLSFSAGNCTSGPNRPLNTFLNQSPFLDSNGCPVYASPDLAFVDNSLSVQVPTCPDQNFLVSFEIENLGDIDLAGNLPITFYEGDPNTATANKLNTETVIVTNLSPGNTMAINDLTVNGTGGSFILYIVLNDDGTTIPLNLPNTDFFECDYSNNILSENIDPFPFSLSAETTDNTVCDVTLAGSGSARAYRLVGTTEETADYTFYWHNGNTVSGAADFTGAVYSNLSDGDYTVYAVHNTAGCSSDTVTVTVNLTPGSVTAAIILQNQYTNCNNPNGHLLAEVNGGEPVGFFTYEWYQGDNIFTSPLIGTSHSITNLGPGQYTLLVTEKSTGCQTIETYTIIDDSAPPVVTATATDASCPNPTSGSVTANVTGGNGGHSFEWYIGNNIKPVPDYTTRVVNNLPAGDYTVVATKNSDQCSSTPVTVTVNIPPDPVVTASMVSEQTSCDTGNPNGAVTANVGGLTTGFTFTWYQGQGTAGAVVSNTANANGLSAGPYTVLVVNDLTGCSSTEEVTVTETITYPTVSVGVDSDQTDCAPPNGQLSANAGGVTAGFTFLWYDGNIGTPDLNNPDATGVTYAGLTAGDYTVVAVNNSTQCPSPSVVATIADNTVIPTIAVNVTDQTSCDPLSPNGQLAANVGGSTTGFTFTWFQGASTGGTVISNGATVSGLPAGVYTVLAVNDATGCSNTSQTTLNNNFTYPTVTAAVDANQTICDPVIGYDGQVSADVGGVTAGFTFLWYDGNIGTPDLSNPDFTGPVYSGLTAGTYTVVALSTATSCPSATATVTVADNTVIPAIAVNVTDQTSCDLTNPNGQLSANVGGTTAGYTFTWHQGAGTGGAVISHVATAAGLSAGVYTVEVVNDATGCSNTSQTTLNNNLTYPVVTPVVDANQDDCVPANGQLSANVGGVTAGFTFLWYDGNVGTPDISNPDATGVTYTGLTAGDYTVVAVNNNTQCPSPPVVATIADNTVIPTISVNVTDQTSCDPLSPNGQLAANVGGSTAGFTFTWFQGAGTGGAVISNVATASNLPAGVYTVFAVNDATGCSNTSQTTLNNNFTYPTVTAAVDANQTICDPVIGYDGQVSADVGGVTAGFTFLWYDGNIGTPDLSNPDFTGPVYSGLTAGTYTVVALSTATSCPSATATVTVADNTVIPAIAVNVTDQTSCDLTNPNGQLSANVGGTTAGYTFTWYQGAGTGGAVISHVATAAGLSAGVYTVEVVNDATGCSNTSQTTLNNNLTYPVVTPVVDANQSDCMPPNGQLSANVGGLTAGFTFLWYHGNVGTPDISNPDATGSTYAGLTAGEYTVVAVNNNTSCASSPVVAQIADNTVLPNVVASKTDNTACDPSLYNGTIAAGIGVVGTIAGHTFHIFNGQTTSPASEVPGSPSDNLSGLTAGIYTVQAINNATGCSNTIEVTVDNNIVQPVLSVLGADVMNCNPLDGSVTASVSIGNVADYTFSWYDGNSVKATTDYLTTGNILSGLDAGTYTVNAYNNVLGCLVQAPQTITIDRDASAGITITELPAELTIPSSCNIGGGQLGVQAASPGNTGGFTFTWYEGDVNTSLTLIGNGTDFPVNSNRLSSLASGRYTVIAQDNDTGCEDTLSIDLPYAGSPTLLSITIQDNDDCSVGNGSFTVDVDPSAAAVALGANESWFTVQIWKGSQMVDDQLGNNPHNVFSGLDPGEYTIVAVETNAALSGCTTTENATIGNTAVPPAITANSILDNRNCSGATGTGLISLTIDGVANPGAGYDYNWYQGQTTADPVLPPGNITTPGHTAFDLTSGYYTVEVIDNTDPNNTCSSVATFFVGDDPFIISINSADINLTHQTDCAPPFLGDATVTDVYIDGASNGGVAVFTFEWFESDGVTLISGAGTGDSPAVNIAAGNYFVRAINTTSNCMSSLVAFDILDNTVAPNVVMVQDAPNTICDIVTFTPNGRLLASVTEGVTTGVTAGYDFEWFTGQNNTTTGDELPAGNIAGASGEIAQNLAPGFYTVRVTDNNTPNNNCQTIATMQVQDIPDIVNILTADIGTTDQEDCSPIMGSATVNQVIVNGMSQVPAPGDFDFDWYQSDASTSITGAGDDPTIGVNLTAGTYFVQATSNITGCATSLVQFEIQDLTQAPVVVMVQEAPNTICDMVNFTPNGRLSASVTEGITTGVTAGYDFEWFTGQNNTASGDELPAGNITGANGEIAQNLPPGFYTVRVTDNNTPNNNCQTIATMQVQDIPDIVNILTADIGTTDQEDCSPIMGSATVNQVIVNGMSQVPAPGDFDFDWYQSDASTSITGAGDDPTIGVNLTAGTYFVQATSNITGCATSLVQFEIQDLTQAPVVVMVQEAPNTICDMVNFTPNGRLSASVTEGITTGVTAGYDFEWFTGQNNTASGDELPAGNITGANGEIAQNLPPGFYTVRVTDNNTPNDNCQTVATMEVQDMPDMVVIAAADIIINDQTNCLPINGSASVNTVMVNGMGQATSDFTFNWYENDGISLIPGAGNGPTVGVNLPADTYFVQAISDNPANPNASGCASSLVEFEIEDLTALPEITLVSFTNPTVCDQPNILGELSVTADGSTNTTDYTFTWYQGTDASGIPVPGNNPVINGITAGGNYYLEVTHNTTGCMSSEQYTLLTEIQEIRLSANSTDVTDCVNPDGTLFATVTSGGSNNYDYNWYVGNTVTGTPDYTGKNVSDLDMGDYTIIAVDQGDPTCTSMPVTLTIGDGRMYPQLELVQVNPVTNCDPSRPNGAAKATVNGIDIGFTFEWFVGSGISGAPFYTGSQANGLSGVTYTVLATNIYTGCTTIEQITIDENFDEMPLPAPEIISHQTSCIASNGEITVSVGGNTADYIFTWYSGQDTSGPSIYTGDLFTGLDPGFYTVTATDINSGCVSEGVTVELIEDLAYPEFELVIENADCGESNGSIKLNLNSQTIIQRIEWETPVGTVFGPSLLGYPVGDYEVTVTTDLGCTATKSGTILPNIIPYNGVSFNGDGLNDFFVVSCLEQYPNNKVKIFNRAGTLVYETDGYNNVDNIFDGTANKGISVLGNKLPSGTYFYVIDKMDNSEAVSGYLELLNE